MSRNKQILIFSGLGLAVLGGVTALLMLTAPEKKDKELTIEEKLIGVTEAETDENGEKTEPEEKKETPSLTLSQREAKDVKSIEITNGSGTYAITPSGKTDSDGAVIWTIADIAQAPLLADSLNSAVTEAASLSAKEFAEEVADSAELAKYGLDKPKATVRANFTDGSELSFRIGNDVPNSSTTVYMTTDGKKVYTAVKNSVNIYLEDKLGFVDKKVFHDYDNSSDETVNKMTIERADLEKPIVLESLKAGPDEIQVFSFRLVSPYTAYADLNDSPAFIYGLFGLTAESCEAVGPSDNDLELAGFDDPKCVVTFETDVKTYKLTIGNAIISTSTDDSGNEKKTITGFYGISSEVPDVLYKFDINSVPALGIDPSKLISKLFLMPYILSLDSVTYSDKDGRSVEIKIEYIKSETEDGQDTENYYVNGKKAESSRPVKDLYQYFLSASGEELYFDEDKGELLAELTYHYLKPTDGIDGKDTVRFYSSNTDRKVIINLNGQNLYKTQQIYVTQLYKNIENFLTGGEIVSTY